MIAGLWVHTFAAMDRIIGTEPFEPSPVPQPDPLLLPSEAPNVLDTVDPAWGLGSAHPDYPPRAAARALREVHPDPAPCVFCNDTGLVVTHEDGGAGYRPCYRCPAWSTGGAA